MPDTTPTESPRTTAVAAIMDALTAGQPLSRDEARALLSAVTTEERRAGWRAGFHQADTDEYHQALNDGRPSADERGVHYEITEGRPDGYPVWRITRSLGANHREVTAYRHPTAAEIVASALNTAARHED
jgi:hypothetical protein